MKYRYFDTHVHLNTEPLYSELSQYLTLAKDNKILMNVVGVDLETCNKAIEIANDDENCFFSLGIHPEDVSSESVIKLEELIIKNINNKKFIAIGECGLDYHYENFDKNLQKECFIKQIEFSVKYKKPLVLHIRDAYQDAFDILSKYTDNISKILLHCFDGDENTVSLFNKIDCYFAIGGKITYKKSDYLCNALKYIPLNRLLTETDAPWLAPVPFRGKINSSDKIYLTVEKISTLLNLEISKLQDLLVSNAIEFFNIEIENV